MKPCPFCGNNILKPPERRVVTWVECLNCGACGPLMARRYPEDIGVQFDAIESQAIDLWDNRVEIK